MGRALMSEANNIDKAHLKLAAELAEFDAVELAERIRKKELSPKEAVEASVAAVEILDKEINFRCQDYAEEAIAESGSVSVKWTRAQWLGSASTATAGWSAGRAGC